jgi:hypothetical protein
LMADQWDPQKVLWMAVVKAEPKAYHLVGVRAQRWAAHSAKQMDGHLAAERAGRTAGLMVLMRAGEMASSRADQLGSQSAVKMEQRRDSMMVGLMAENWAHQMAVSSIASTAQLWDVYLVAQWETTTAAAKAPMKADCWDQKMDAPTADLKADSMGVLWPGSWAAHWAAYSGNKRAGRWVHWKVDESVGGSDLSSVEKSVEPLAPLKELQTVGRWADCWVSLTELQWVARWDKLLVEHLVDQWG